METGTKDVHLHSTTAQGRAAHNSCNFGYSLCVYLRDSFFAGMRENRTLKAAWSGDVESFLDLRAKTNHHREVLQLLQGS